MMKFAIRWATASATMPFLAAAMLTGVAALFGGGSAEQWVGGFYSGTVRAIFASPQMLLTMVVLGFASASLSRLRDGRRAGAARRSPR